MKFRAWHLYLIIIGLGTLIGGVLDYSYPTKISGNSFTNGWEGVGYAFGVTTFYGGILLIFYYLCVYWYKRKTKSKSYI